MTGLNLISSLALLYFVGFIHQIQFIKKDFLFRNSKFPQLENHLILKPSGLYRLMENLNAPGK